MDGFGPRATTEFQQSVARPEGSIKRRKATSAGPSSYRIGGVFSVIQGRGQAEGAGRCGMLTCGMLI
jgi:hypothetical protein